MKKYLDKTISFFAASLRSTAPESSKRLFGAIGFITAIIYIAIWGRDLIETLLYVSAALLGLESITQIFKKK
jgi:formate/nitrite transporter FocA (FNT family)